MLFNSFEFILLFLPICLGGYYLLCHHHNRIWPTAWLAACSLFFYGWWNPVYIALIVSSILGNYSLGRLLARRANQKALLALGVAANLALLGYYKYTDFLIANINALTGTGFAIQHIVLPLGISFFTFTQIAYLVDVFRQEVREYNLVDYFLFVTYFPHLIAGPILHHKEMMPQFATPGLQRMTAHNVTAGLVMFTIGLIKKIWLADTVATYARPVFAAAEQGATLTFFEGWSGALSYTLQLYFDFSGYVDMALGLSLLFGIRLPLNFASPYQSTSIIEFWRRWHMTLSRFLRDYLYIGLGGNRHGTFRRYLNLMLTMLLGGLWHGAGWTFVIWGGLHGTYLCINHGWRALCAKLSWTFAPSHINTLVFGAITFIAVVIAWVFFRAESASGALHILQGMAGCNGVTLPIKYGRDWGAFAHWLSAHGVMFDDNLFKGGKQFSQVFWLLLVVFLLPNSQTLLQHYRVATNQHEGVVSSRFAFVPNAATLIVVFAALLYGFLHVSQLSEFLYFRF